LIEGDLNCSSCVWVGTLLQPVASPGIQPLENPKEKRKNSKNEGRRDEGGRTRRVIRDDER
jgi:hypothetical protein